MNLNDSQQQAVYHREGPLMVLAGPGSGKTTVITYRALQLVKEAGVHPRQIMVITFSKGAATEMEQRFRALAGDIGCTFGTFHGIFFRVLRQRYGYGIEQVLHENERRDLIRSLVYKLGFEADEDMMSAVRNEISLVKNELYELQYYNSTIMGAEEFRQLYLQYEEAKHAQNKIDFDDMLTLCYYLWQNEPSCLDYWQKKFPYIMIDEFQDINHVQYECMKMLSAAPHHLCIVGDDDQSIYRFRGSRPEFLLRFPKDYPQVQKILLATNYRSTEPIIAFSNSLISQNQVRYDKTIVGTQRKGPKPKIVHCKDQNQEASLIADHIKKIKNKNSNESLNEIAIIYRTNMQARAFVDAFMQANIPYIVKDEISVIYEHWIARDIFAYLRGNAEDIERIINKPFRFISKAFLQKAKQQKRNIFEWYAQSGMLNVPQQQRIEELMFDLMAIKKRTTVEAVQYIRKKAGYDNHIKDYCDYRKVSPSGLYEIVSEIQEAAAAFPDPQAFMDHAEEAIQNKKPKNQEDERVTLTTMHSAKGLEFDTVYIAGAVEGLIPHERSKAAAEIEEERRLFYVGATRARHNLYISVIKKRHEKTVEPSRFIKNLQKRR
ncbi:MAG: ATP-dependent helicase [Defluviitaleaceae bacterium]|nr:ATP-dependent helicase [Defluviitaleaceae bacterium]